MEKMKLHVNGRSVTIQAKVVKAGSREGIVLNMRGAWVLVSMTGPDSDKMRETRLALMKPVD